MLNLSNEPQGVEPQDSGVISSEDLRKLAKAYYVAKGALLRNGFAEELDWQYGVTIEGLTEREFLRETAWVVLSSGMSENVIRSKFESISRAFYNWKSSEVIAQHPRVCKAEAFSYFGHGPKLDAVIKIATHVYETGFSAVIDNVKDRGVTYLMQFPFLGPATSYHLAKNIGLPVAKPDRHLVRIAESLGYYSVQQLCADIASATGEPIPIVDLVLWRFSRKHQKYVNRWSRGFQGRL